MLFSNRLAISLQLLWLNVFLSLENLANVPGILTIFIVPSWQPLNTNAESSWLPQLSLLLMKSDLSSITQKLE